MDNDFCDFINDHSHHSIHSLLPIHDEERENTNVHHDMPLNHRKTSHHILGPPGRAPEMSRCVHKTETDLLREQREMSEKYKKKLVRNRESAKNSRKRKKTYLDLLEKKVN